MFCSGYTSSKQGMERTMGGGINMQTPQWRGGVEGGGQWAQCRNLSERLQLPGDPGSQKPVLPAEAVGDVRVGLTARHAR